MFTDAPAIDLDPLDIAFTSSALFDQYDEPLPSEAANDATYENLYPNIA